MIAEGLGKPLNSGMIIPTKVTAMDDAKHVEGPSHAHTGTDWDRLKKMTDEDIERAVESDPDAAPILTAEEIRQFKLVPARIKR